MKRFKALNVTKQRPKYLNDNNKIGRNRIELKTLFFSKIIITERVRERVFTY